MPALTDEPRRGRHLMHAVNEILLRDGVAALTMRHIARTSRVPVSSIYHQLDSRERLLRVAGGTFSKDRHLHLTVEIRDDGPLALLPRNDTEVLVARLWLAWQELWRCDPAVESTLARAARQERGLVALATDHLLDPDRLALTQAVLDGLRAAICAPVSPMRPTTARDLLADHLGQRRTPRPADLWLHDLRMLGQRDTAEAWWWARR